MARTKNEELHKKRKRQILAAARKCFVEKGIHTASMQDICKAGKISPGALYRYFPSKKAIIEALAAEEQQQNSELLAYLRAAANPAKALKDASGDILKTITNPQFARLMIEMSSEASRDADIHKAFYEPEEAFRRELLDIFYAQAAPLNALKRAEIDAAVLTYLALLDGITIRAASEELPAQKHLKNQLEKLVTALF